MCQSGYHNPNPQEDVSLVNLFPVLKMKLENSPSTNPLHHGLLPCHTQYLSALPTFEQDLVIFPMSSHFWILRHVYATMHGCTHFHTALHYLEQVPLFPYL
jgi:hypothetical protein